MKKILAILLAVFMLISVTSVTAFAEDASTGSITVSNPMPEKTYEIYKVFSATYFEEADSTKKVSYTIKATDQFYDDLFGADGNTTNIYFNKTLNADESYTVEKRSGVDDVAVIAYLQGIIDNNALTADATIVATENDETITFDNLEFGYYIVKSSLGTAVTITSVIPSVEIVDKNQKPGIVDLKVWDDVNKDDAIADDEWKESNSAKIGDDVTYKLSAVVTNYNGKDQIAHYSLVDTTGTAIFAKYETIKVYVGGQELNRGYFIGDNTAGRVDDKFIGEGWTDANKAVENAQFFIVSTNDADNQFRVTVPWMDNYTLNETLVNDDPAHTTAVLEFAANSKSVYGQTTELVVTFDAVVEANATIGNVVAGADNNINTAELRWTNYAHGGSASSPVSITTFVYGHAITKVDGKTGAALAGVKFKVYSDDACTTPVNVVMTNVPGVYIVDDGFDNAKHDSVRKQDYYTAGESSNEVVTPVNGKIVILGFDKEQYYLEETETAPGYNLLYSAITLTVGDTIPNFEVYTNAEGEVVDADDNNSGTYTTNSYMVNSQEVQNFSGAALPETGGLGTFLFILIGAILAIISAVFMITRKKMSAYVD